MFSSSIGVRSWKPHGNASVDEIGATLFKLMVDTASGTKSKSERHGYGQSEFVPWYVGAVM